MTIDERAHDLALTVAKFYIEANSPEYKTKNGIELLVEDLVSVYSENFELIKQRIK